MAESSRFDVVVVGGGPAGLLAALAAAAGTSSVALLDENPSLGGQIWRPDVVAGHSREGRAAVSAVGRSAVSVMHGTTVVDASASGGRFRFLIDTPAGQATIESATVILATGARELFLPFPGWTLPGVLGVGAAQAMVKGGMSVRGKRVVVAGTGPLLVAVAATLASKGAEIIAVAEQAPMHRMLPFAAGLAMRPHVAFDALRYAQQLPGGTLRFGSWVSAAVGRHRISGVVLSDGSNDQRVDCDLACVGYGLVPGIELARLLGCAATARGIAVDDRQHTSVDGVFAAGECTGIAGVESAVLQGLIAGEAAVGADRSRSLGWRRDHAERWAATLDRTFALRAEVLALVRPETIVCRCEDVRLGAIDERWTARQAKLYARVGMGACQGRVCGAAMRSIRHWDLDSVRAPLQPITLSSLAAPSAGELNRS